MNIRPFTDALRRHGRWQRDYDSRCGGGRTVQFSHLVDEHRCVEVQLFDDGRHRATHAYRCHMTTLPTEFSDVAGMLRAIEIESTRTDNNSFGCALATGKAECSAAQCSGCLSHPNREWRRELDSAAAWLHKDGARPL
jgi:hypothetical protein